MHAQRAFCHCLIVLSIVADGIVAAPRAGLLDTLSRVQATLGDAACSGVDWKASKPRRCRRIRSDGISPCCSLQALVGAVRLPTGMLLLGKC